jgi:two-component system, cell cycle sensor histidine kinase and response regulator CckA
LEEAGYKILEAENVKQAFEKSETHPGVIDLLLTDVILPELSGPQLATRLAPLRSEMRILYMTGHSEEVAVRQCVVAAGQALLMKPFSGLGLLSAVRKSLAKK